MTALSKVLRIDHVQLAMPGGSEDHARGFYRDVLGMKEIPKNAKRLGLHQSRTRKSMGAAAFTCSILLEIAWS